MYPISSINRLKMFGTKERNILVVDLSMGYHIAVYNSKEKTLINFHTRKTISEPIMWDYLPEFDEDCFENECEKLSLLFNYG